MIFNGSTPIRNDILGVRSSAKIWKNALFADVAELISKVLKFSGNLSDMTSVLLLSLNCP